MTIEDLRERARKRGIAGYSNMPEAELEAAVGEVEAAKTAAATAPVAVAEPEAVAPEPEADEPETVENTSDDDPVEPENDAEDE